ncbi:sporulation peptidase YabG [Paraliobacillus quinghaiensis]|uniref:Sporulation peptidase YabG n=1 Tax=Paraliobacillus quinghaiensis TaxID=470815 RepID=A0A917WX37_9BACI|nr:sporulation peptidase YabG [Paraliobacillus quinghaiensis]GGM36753.1 sporulation peptidase YabG [Paraliobacillus quinghaiensis]
MSFTIGDLVTRISYQHDILFRITAVTNGTAVLHGEDIRLEADADLGDLKKAHEREVEKHRMKDKEKEDYSFRLFRQDYQLMKEKRTYESTSGYQEPANFFQLPARVLHLDGDRLYLKKCIDLYQRIGLQVHGLYVDEKEMSQEIGHLITKIQPDMIVITGHDAYSRNKGERKDLRAYRHSKYFVDTVREARKIVPNVDQLVIFAGACQSHFESLIRAGANFASSPSRINIHALDPVYITAKVAYTSFMDKVSVHDALRNTLTGDKGLGGIETRGLLRTGMPYIEESDIE